MGLSHPQWVASNNLRCQMKRRQSPVVTGNSTVLKSLILCRPVNTGLKGPSCFKLHQAGIWQTNMTGRNMHICKELCGIFSVGFGFELPSQLYFIGLWSMGVVGFEGPASLVLEMLKIFHLQAAILFLHSVMHSFFVAVWLYSSLSRGSRSTSRLPQSLSLHACGDDTRA